MGAFKKCHGTGKVADENIIMLIQLGETEAARDALRKDLAALQRRFSESNDVHSLKERELQTALQESQEKERQLEDLRRHLEAALNSRSAEVDNLKLQLSTAEGKVGALESRIYKLEGKKMRKIPIICKVRSAVKMKNSIFIL